MDDGAFEAFASCRFGDAARLAAAELASQGKEQLDRKEDSPFSMNARDESTFLPCAPWNWEGDGRTDERRILIRLEEHCRRTDKLAAILLQCAFELKEEEQERLFIKHYTTQKNIPLPVALIWLRVCLTKGRFWNEAVRRAVTQLLAALHTEIHLMLPNGINGTKSPSKVSEVSHPLEGEDEADIIEGVRKHLYAPGEQEKASSMAKNSEGANKRLVAVLSMYSQVMELLILKIMLESGHAEPALQRVRSDSYLEDGVRQALVDACRAAIKRQRTLMRQNARGNGKRGETQSLKHSTHAAPSTFPASCKRGNPPSSPQSSSGDVWSQSLSDRVLNAFGIKREDVDQQNSNSPFQEDSHRTRTSDEGDRCPSTHRATEGRAGQSWQHVQDGETCPDSNSGNSCIISRPLFVLQGVRIMGRMITSSPYQILISVLGFVVIVLGYSIRRGLRLGNRPFKRFISRVLQRAMAILWLVGGKREA